MKDWRIKWENCHDCAEFADYREPNDYCKKCVCYACEHDRDKCLMNKYCGRDDKEIEWE